jgi:TPR repeat protein
MKRRVVLSCFAFLLGFSSTVDAQQEPPQAQSAKRTQCTEDDRKELLAKAQRGDANSEMWLAAAYEQGRFGERNYSEALKWFRKSAAKGESRRTEFVGPDVRGR